jgi:ribonuclease J
MEGESARPMREFFAPCRKTYLHSGGHASPDILQKFAKSMKPDLLISVHGEAWGSWAEGFPNLRIAADGEWLELKA